MKRKPFIIILVGLFACGALAWFSHSPTPAIRFVEFRDGQNGRVAIFRIVNDSDASYSYIGYNPSSPLYNSRVLTTSGWLASGPNWFCGTGAGMHTISPHTTTDFQVRPLSDSPDSAFSVGIHFERGTAAELQSHSRSRSHISKFVDWLRHWINSDYHEREPTWSTVTQTQ